MKDRILPKSQLAEYLDRLMKTATVIAPVEQEGENFSLYQPLSRGEKQPWDIQALALGVGKFFSPE